MMNLRFDDDFLEGAVFLRARAKAAGIAPVQIARFQRERDALYQISDPDERNAAFFDLHLAWFREWGMEEALVQILREFPELEARLASLSFRKARHGAEEGAELYVQPASGEANGSGRMAQFAGAGGSFGLAIGDGKAARAVGPCFPSPSRTWQAPAPKGEGEPFWRSDTGQLGSNNVAPSGDSRPTGSDCDKRVRNAVVAIRLERLARPALYEPFLRHELMHVSDMVAPDFGYAPLDTDAAQEQIIRSRYRLLWDITIDGRLAQQNKMGQSTRSQRWAEFQRAYSFLPETAQSDTFEDLWFNPSPRHERLLSVAADARGYGATHAPAPGAPCPLCQFPTFAWAAAEDLAESTRERIRRGYPDWLPSQGVCARCVEMFEATAKFPIPATVWI